HGLCLRRPGLLVAADRGGGAARPSGRAAIAPPASASSDPGGDPAGRTGPDYPQPARSCLPIFNQYRAIMGQHAARFFPDPGPGAPSFAGTSPGAAALYFRNVGSPPLLGSHSLRTCSSTDSPVSVVGLAVSASFSAAASGRFSNSLRAR